MKAYYCVGTHWDREWYEPFQEFRMWLVELIDELMDLMEGNPEYPCFHLDGQSVVLQDYLEIRPERKEQLVSLLKEGRLIAGPWYDLPDEWLISGESYVRNIMMGSRVCRELGFEPMPFGYTPDQFGHIAALPMILKGFGLKGGICWRGTQDDNYPAFFNWVGPDGSRLPTHKLADNASYAPFLPVRHKLRDEGYTEENVRLFFDEFLAKETVRTPTPILLMLDATDHQRPDPKMPWIFDTLKKLYPMIAFEWCSLTEMAQEMVKHSKKFPERKGELREPCRDSTRGWQYLIVHVISSRYPIKQRNDQCQVAMEKWAEPTALFQLMDGGTPILSYLDKAWEYLLRNHPHDSICGCSIDQVHRDMQYRFDQTEWIADGIVRRALAAYGKASEKLSHINHVVVHNPLPFDRKGIFEVAIPFPCDWPKRYIDGLATSELFNKFQLVDGKGKRVPFQLSRIERSSEQKILSTIGRRNTQVCDIYHLAVEFEVPSCGYSGFKVEPTDEGVRNFGSCMTGPLTASTGSVSLQFNPDGSARVEAYGRVFDGLFLYEDAGDCGDGWTRGQLINDIVYRSPGTRVTTAIEEDGALRTVFRIEREFDLPSLMDRKTLGRSNERVTMRLTDWVYVDKDAPYIRVRTHLNNTIQDHRFRVLFPTHVDTNHSFAETPFAVVDRDIIIPPETAAWQERINPEKAFTTFCGVQDKKGGFAVLAPFGLHEYEVTQTKERTLALTLFRSTFKTVGTPGEPDGELLGEMDFEYLLYPFAGTFDPVKVSRLVAASQAKVRTHLAESLPEAKSFFRTKNTAIVSAIKPAADQQGGIVRLWNPTAKPVKEVLTFEAKIKSAALCNLNEELGKALKVEKGHRMAVEVPAGGLVTIRFTW